ncbi:polyisoprenoid-binding protein YceI [Lipingzhangella halophila]|uniref:Polyisoprenoid-binding protein YceI n=1 Tax=Lipingzhangella halophila TaxID=1783352 RepID=A0A7W7RFD0_9ACTN|nr:YceI family protein [Lipingzhangella halophila]MBB4930924.1 polyisoprenoid-binding protein YceI [Lipingzhangella halophila]
MTDQELIPGTWEIDPTHSMLSFSVRHMMVSRVRGRFEKFDATLTVPEDPTKAAVRATIDADSINTDSQQRDDHLRSADFFEAATHPQWTFESTGIRQSGEDFVLTGDLTIKGNTQPVELTLEFNGVTKDPWGMTRCGFHAETEISRSAFGVDIEMPMETGGVVVGDRIKIDIDAEFTHQSA